PNARKLGCGGPPRVVSTWAAEPLAPAGPFEHPSTLKLIESPFGLRPLTARDANAMTLGQILHRRVRRPVPAGAIPTSSQVPGPADDAAPFCSAARVQPTSPAPPSR